MLPKFMDFRGLTAIHMESAKFIDFPCASQSLPDTQSASSDDSELKLWSDTEKKKFVEEKNSLPHPAEALISVYLYDEDSDPMGDVYDMGVGIIISETGLVMVAAHDLYVSEKKIVGKFMVNPPSRKRYDASLVHIDKVNHVAFIQIICSPKKKWPVATLGSFSGALMMDPFPEVITMVFDYFGKLKTRTCSYRALGPCGEFSHFVMNPFQDPAVFVYDGKVIGLESGNCCSDDSLVHVIPIEYTHEALAHVKSPSMVTHNYLAVEGTHARLVHESEGGGQARIAEGPCKEGNSVMDQNVRSIEELEEMIMTLHEAQVKELFSFASSTLEKVEILGNRVDLLLETAKDLRRGRTCGSRSSPK